MINLKLLNQWLRQIQNHNFQLNENDIIVLDFNRLCRLCLAEVEAAADSDEFLGDEGASKCVYDIYTTNIPLDKQDLPSNDQNRKSILLKDILDMFFVTHLDEDNTSLPTKICPNCFKTIWRSYLFIYQCKQASATLRLYTNVISKLKTPTTCEAAITEDVTHPADSVDIDEEKDKNNIFFKTEEESIEIVCDKSEEATTLIDQTEILEEYDVELIEEEEHFGQDDEQNMDVEFLENDTEVADACDTNDTKANVQTSDTNFVRPNKSKDFLCKICNQTYSQAQTLNRHMKIHRADQRNKLCTFCGKCFLRSDDLRRHIRTHTGERPYACDKCPKRYKQTSELKQHQISHSNQKNFVCTICGKALSSRNGLYVHMKAHRGEKNYECKACGNKYLTSAELTSHTKHIHGKNKLYVCKICSSKYPTSAELSLHKKVSHAKKKKVLDELI